MAPHIANFLLGSFGIVAAVLLIGGSIALRWQRSRNYYDLSRRALEAGTPLPKASPLWLASRRQALSILAVGVGLMIVGCGAWWLGSGVSPPTNATVAMMVPPAEPAEPFAPGRDSRPPHPPMPSPEMERWHSAQERVAIGQTALGSGIILVLLGVVRIGYSGTEKRVAETIETI